MEDEYKVGCALPAPLKSSDLLALYKLDYYYYYYYQIVPLLMTLSDPDGG